MVDHYTEKYLTKAMAKISRGPTILMLVLLLAFQYVSFGHTSKNNTSSIDNVDDKTVVSSTASMHQPFSILVHVVNHAQPTRTRGVSAFHQPAAPVAFSSDATQKCLLDAFNTAHNNNIGRHLQHVLAASTMAEVPPPRDRCQMETVKALGSATSSEKANDSWTLFHGVVRLQDEEERDLASTQDGDPKDKDTCPCCPLNTLRPPPEDEMHYRHNQVQLHVQHRLWEASFCACMNRETFLPTLVLPLFDCHIQVQPSTSVVRNWEEGKRLYDDHANDNHEKNWNDVHLQVSATFTTATTTADQRLSQQYLPKLTTPERYAAQLCLVEAFEETHPPDSSSALALLSARVLEETHSLNTATAATFELHKDGSLRGSGSTQPAVPSAISRNETTAISTALKMHVVAIQIVHSSEGHADDELSVGKCPICVTASPTASGVVPTEELLLWVESLSLLDLVVWSDHMAWEDSFCHCLADLAGGDNGRMTSAWKRNTCHIEVEATTD